jgi:OOP family OmpA-OmpF porin
MHGHATLLALIVPGILGCEPSLRAPEEPRAKGPQATATPSATTYVPAPATQTSAPVETPTGLPEAALAPQSPPPVPDHVPRCPAPKSKSAPPGALAWVSACLIKTAKPIHFAFDSEAIRAESVPILDAIAEILHIEHSFRVEIGAHSDGRGAWKYNKELTQKRAEAVKDHLVGKGIDPERLRAWGYGDERPISHPPLVDGRRTNRRIEFVLLP